MASSYNGWPASRDPDAIRVNRSWEPIKGHKFPGGIKSGDVEVVMTYLVVNLDARVEPIEEYPPGDEWGYNFRANVNNPDQLSCHASATAVDYNATQHPNHVDFTWTRDQTRTIHKIIDDELEGVIRWLEGYDEMHFEIRGSATRVKFVANKIRNMSNPVPPNIPPVLSKDGDMFSYHVASGTTVIVESGKQVEVAGDVLEAKVHSMPTHIGIVGSDETARFERAYGPVIR